MAELENYKKRTLQEKSKLLKYSNEQLLRDLLPVLDNMERALAHCSEAGRSDALADGVCLIVGMFKDILERYGVKEIKAIGETFDPHLHEAIARQPEEGKPANIWCWRVGEGLYVSRPSIAPGKSGGLIRRG